jgi:hypothetical protein
MKTMSAHEFAQALRAQGVPRDHVAVKCPICGTVQTLEEVRAAAAAASPDHLVAYFGASQVDAELHFGFDCIGRFRAAGPFRGGPAGAGCNWTLGGFLKAHELEVIDDSGVAHPYFEPVTAQEAQAHMLQRQVVPS